MHVRRFKELSKDPWFTVGAGLALVFAVIAVLGPWIAPFDPWDMSFTPLSPPSGPHLLGVNDGGQDIFSELFPAVRNTMTFGLLCGLAALVAGVFLGLLSGWFGGRIDLALMRLADVILAVPSIMVLIFIAALFRPPPLVLALILACLSWPPIARGVRAQTLVLREGLHIKAAARMGAGSLYILRRHLLPEMYPLYLVGFAARARMAMFMEASLAFLGLFDPTRKSLGAMISYALKYYYLDIWWNWLAPPVVCLSLLIMTVTFLAVSLEKVLDPRLRQGLGA